MNSLEEILPSKLFQVLDRNGICTTKQITLLSVWDLKKVTKMNSEDIQLVKDIVCEHIQPKLTLCHELLLIEKVTTKVSSGCQEIDNILRGGFKRGTITEVYGESGSGKTQIGIQASVFNWTEGCVYICTEDLFPIKRYEQMKKNIPGYCSNIDYGQHTFIEHITEADDLLSCIRIRLPTLLLNKKICLVVIDSVAAPFRVESMNYIQRADILREFAYSLIKLSRQYNIAVVCINQVTAVFDESERVAPSLGLAWSNMIATRLELKKSKKELPLNENAQHVLARTLSVEFSPDLPNSMTRFIITESGIHGISEMYTFSNN